MRARTHAIMSPSGGNRFSMQPSSDGPGLRSGPLTPDVELAILGPMVSVRTSVAEGPFASPIIRQHTPAAKHCMGDRERLACNGYACG